MNGLWGSVCETPENSCRCDQGLWVGSAPHPLTAVTSSVYQAHLGPIIACRSTLTAAVYSGGKELEMHGGLPNSSSTLCQGLTRGHSCHKIRRKKSEEKKIKNPAWAVFSLYRQSQNISVLFMHEGAYKVPLSGVVWSRSPHLEARVQGAPWGSSHSNRRCG